MSSSAAPEPSQVVDLRTFARGHALRACQTAWLVGAGGSAEAGVPTAGQLIGRLLIELYASDHEMTVSAVEADPHWQAKALAVYSGQRGLPDAADDGFYSAIFQETFPDQDARARFVMEQMSGVTPHYGQHVLGALLGSELAPLAITTNFEQLIEDATRPMLEGTGKRLTVLQPQNAAQSRFTLATDQGPTLIKLHGDLGTVTLLNTELELARHEPPLRDFVRVQLARFGLLVAGYSGRDRVIMDLLRSVLAGPNPYPAGLTWVRRPEDELSSVVEEFLADARRADVQPVQVVIAGGFGELMTELGRACRPALTETARRRLDQLRPPKVRRAAAKPQGPTQTYPQVRFAAVEVTGLSTAARLLQGDPPPIREIRRALKAAGVRATVGLVAGDLLAFGADDDVRRALAPLNLAVTDETVRLDFDTGSTATVGIALDALTQGLGATPGLTSMVIGRRPILRASRTQSATQQERRVQLPPAIDQLRKAVGGTLTGEMSGPNGAKLPWAEAVRLGLDRLDASWVLLFAPDIWVRPRYVSTSEPAPSREEAQRAGAEFVRERLAPRYNRQTGEIIDAWVRLISGTGRTVRAFNIEAGRGVDAEFTLGRPVLSHQLRAVTAMRTVVA